MGADMLVYMIPAASPTDDRKAAFAEWLSQLNMEPGDGLNELYDSGTLDNVLDDTEASFDEDGVLLPEMQTQLREHIQSKMDDYWSWSTDGSYRDTSDIYADGRPYFVTGGLSWGDLPTERAEIIDFLGYLPDLVGLLEGWALEDAVEKNRASVEALSDELTAALSG